jgi:hypothetical protein
MIRNRQILTILVASLSLAACGGLDETPTDVPPPGGGGTSGGGP